MGTSFLDANGKGPYHVPGSPLDGFIGLDIPVARHKGASFIGIPGQDRPRYGVLWWNKCPYGSFSIFSSDSGGDPDETVSLGSLEEGAYPANKVLNFIHKVSLPGKKNIPDPYLPAGAINELKGHLQVCGNLVKGHLLLDLAHGVDAPYQVSQVFVGGILKGCGKTIYGKVGNTEEGKQNHK